jgi:hypothetical protein
MKISKSIKMGNHGVKTIIKKIIKIMEMEKENKSVSNDNNKPLGL